MDERIKTAQRKALCARLRNTGLQSGEECDGDIVQCGICDRTIDEINRATAAAALRYTGEDR